MIILRKKNFDFEVLSSQLCIVKASRLESIISLKTRFILEFSFILKNSDLKVYKNELSMCCDLMG
jgi:hypothetical protein